MDRDLFLRAKAGCAMRCHTWTTARAHRLEAAQAATSARSHAQAVELLLTENRGRESSGQFRLSRTRVSPHLVGSPLQVPEQAGPAQVPAASVSGSSCRRCTPGPGARRALLDLGLKGTPVLTALPSPHGPAPVALTTRVAPSPRTRAHGAAYRSPRGSMASASRTSSTWAGNSSPRRPTSTGAGTVRR